MMAGRTGRHKGPDAPGTARPFETQASRPRTPAFDRRAAPGRPAGPVGSIRFKKDGALAMRLAERRRGAFSD